MFIELKSFIFQFAHQFIYIGYRNTSLSYRRIFNFDHLRKKFIKYFDTDHVVRLNYVVKDIPQSLLPYQLQGLQALTLQFFSF